MIDLTTILEAVIALAVAIITAFVIPWIRNKTTAQERDELLKWVDIAVAAAQQLYHHLDGADRWDYAMTLLAEQGYDVQDAVEAAVLKLHQQMKEPVNAG